MAKQYSYSFSALTSGSTSTSAPWFVGDFRLLTMSFASSASLGESRLTVQGSNDDGFQSALGGATSMAGWSTITGINMIGVTPGMVTFDPPGYRWVRVAVTPATQSAASFTSCVFNGVSF